MSNKSYAVDCFNAYLVYNFDQWLLSCKNGDRGISPFSFVGEFVYVGILMPKKKILCITGTRADFGKLKPLLAFLEQHSDFEMHLVITGMHMLKTYGYTYHEVIQEKYKHYYLLSNQTQNDSMSMVLGNTVSLISRLVEELRPDMIIIHGDRVEALAGASVGALNNCLVCHIEGGEVSGTIDDSIRHAVTKLSHLHLVANEQAVGRLVQLGEKKENIHIIGSPDLDVMNEDKLPSLAAAKQHYGIEFEQYGISIFHPVTTEVERTAYHAQMYFEALQESGKNIIAIYPNNDLGTEYIQAELGKIKSPKWKIFPSLRFEFFLVLLKHAEFIIGNSSAGIREAPLYGIPSIDVGTRQRNRHSGSSIIHSGYEKAQILNAVRQAGHCRRSEPDHTFQGGNGKSSVERFKEVMLLPELWSTPAQKQFIDRF